MKRINTIKKNEDFLKVIKKGKFFKARSMTFYYLKTSDVNYKFGISVSKKLGKAHLRNYYKRWFRSIIDNYSDKYKDGDYFVIIIRKDIKDMKYDEVEEEFKRILYKVR